RVVRDSEHGAANRNERARAPPGRLTVVARVCQRNALAFEQLAPLSRILLVVGSPSQPQLGQVALRLGAGLELSNQDALAAVVAGERAPQRHGWSARRRRSTHRQPTGAADARSGSRQQSLPRAPEIEDLRGGLDREALVLERARLHAPV